MQRGVDRPPLPRTKCLEPDRQADRTDDVTRHRQRHTRHARQCAKLGYRMRMQKPKTDTN